MSNYVHTIKLSGTVTGQQLIDAVKKIADEEVCKRRHEDEADLYMVGQTAYGEVGRLVVEADESLWINPACKYSRIDVRDYEWGGMMSLAISSEKDIENAVIQFRDKLNEELEPLVQRVVEPTVSGYRTMVVSMEADNGRPLTEEELGKAMAALAAKLTEAGASQVLAWPATIAVEDDFVENATKQVVVVLYKEEPK